MSVNRSEFRIIPLDTEHAGILRCVLRPHTHTQTQVHCMFVYIYFDCSHFKCRTFRK